MKTIEEKNRMIAEFMGYMPSKGVYELPFTQWKWMQSVLNGEGIDSTNEFTINEMQFHTSWDWLMPVVEKIEDIGYWFTTYLKPNSTDVVCLIGKIVDNSSTPWKYKEFMEYVGGIKKQATYNAVVKFIEWYNENKKL